ncbi:Oligopeptide ABC transporter, permease protein 2 [Chitinispirillum alkaliphilum]|nr:Oligopeptide ABC transporter, permease protein 2 [Chitinispirillum alkaliphilum]
MKLLRNLLKQPAFVFGAGLFLLTILVAVIGNLVIDAVAINDTVGGMYNPPSSEALLGTDHLGRSVLPMLISGLGSSLYVGFLAGIIATTLGTLLGVYAGFTGGWIDDLINMITNLFLVIPIFVVLLLISSALEDGRSLNLIAIIIGLTAWTWTARSVRAQSASLKSRDHIALARINGAGTFKILMVHILPYLLSYVFMVFIIQLATGILMEASISMIGLGPVDGTSLGIILNEANSNNALLDGAWWAFMPAAVLITVIVFALYTLNTSMEGVFNPRLRK